MANVETKEWALSTAITITCKAAEGGYNKQPLYIELEDLYKKLIALNEDSTKSS